MLAVICWDINLTDVLHGLQKLLQNEITKSIENLIGTSEFYMTLRLIFSKLATPSGSKSNTNCLLT